MNRFKFFLLFAAAVTALTAGVAALRRQHSPSSSSLASWDPPHLLNHLRAAGLDLRAVPTVKNGPLLTSNNFYLTETDKGWEELSMPTVPEWIDQWRGTLFVQRVQNDMTLQDLLEQWDNYYVIAGPYVFFGDPVLLSRLCIALGSLVTSDGGSRVSTIN